MNPKTSEGMEERRCPSCQAILLIEQVGGETGFISYHEQPVCEGFERLVKTANATPVGTATIVVREKRVP